MCFNVATNNCIALHGMHVTIWKFFCFVLFQKLPDIIIQLFKFILMYVYVD